MTRCKTKSFRKFLTILRERCPTIVPVRVRRVDMKGALGDCGPVYDDQGRLSHFSIRIPKSAPWQLQWQVLIHEWAHARTWREGETCDDHDEAWGLEYAHIYREAE